MVCWLHIATVTSTWRTWGAVTQCRLFHARIMRTMSSNCKQKTRSKKKENRGRWDDSAAYSSFVEQMCQMCTPIKKKAGGAGPTEMTLHASGIDVMSGDTMHRERYEDHNLHIIIFFFHALFFIFQVLNSLRLSDPCFYIYKLLKIISLLMASHDSSNTIIISDMHFDILDW